MLQKLLSFRLIRMFILIPVFGLILWSCHQDPSPQDQHQNHLVYSNNYIDSLIAEKLIVVIDENHQPLSHAKVLFGDALNDPFPNNFLTTDEKGLLKIPAAWATSLSVTVDFPDKIRVTYIHQNPQGLLFQLHDKPKIPEYEIFGNTSGHEIVNFDSFLNFGLVLEALNKEELLTFDIQRVISPFKDTLTVIGFDFQVPGNISLPKQKESYFIPLTVEKPLYRIRTAGSGVKKIFGAQGRFPFKPIVDAFRKGVPIYELLPMISFSSGVVQDVLVEKQKTEANLTTSSIPFNQWVPSQAPSLSSQDQVLLAINARQEQNHWYPTDIQRLEPRQFTQFKTPALSDNKQIFILKNKTDFDQKSTSFSRMSTSFVNFLSDRANPIHLLPLIDNPRRISQNEFSAQIPEGAPPEIHPLATFGVLSDLITLNEGQADQQVIANRVWEIYSSKWVDKIHWPEFPQSPDDILTQPAQRLEYIYVGSVNEDSATMGTMVIEKATHITRSAVDF